LGVRRQTLYAYASRDQIEARRDPEHSSRKLYRGPDISTLLKRRNLGRARKNIAASTMAWGEPIIDTRIEQQSVAPPRTPYRPGRWRDRRSRRLSACVQDCLRDKESRGHSRERHRTGNNRCRRSLSARRFSCSQGKSQESSLFKSRLRIFPVLVFGRSSTI
jgi:hypothetical protein